MLLFYNLEEKIFVDIQQKYGIMVCDEMEYPSNSTVLPPIFRQSKQKGSRSTT